MPDEPVTVLGYTHIAGCLVAQHSDPRTWESSGFPWCTCPGGPAEAPSQPSGGDWKDAHREAFPQLTGKENA